MKLFALAPLVIIAQVSSCGQVTVPSIKDYCQRYERVVLTQKEKEQVQTLVPQLRQRIQGNDLDYLCGCSNFKHPVCEARKKALKNG